ncbi:hypothetical protein LCGC14_1466990 [marine sediment metagenome]|uniref:Uncharacterized protein n=1 Tax=marine sediment metagenome TaxID=412755 RepID=A0A0F9JZH4_9ZZZZ
MGVGVGGGIDTSSVSGEIAVKKVGSQMGSGRGDKRNCVVPSAAAEMTPKRTLDSRPRDAKGRLLPKGVKVPEVVLPIPVNGSAPVDSEAVIENLREILVDAGYDREKQLKLVDGVITKAEELLDAKKKISLGRAGLSEEMEDSPTQLGASRLLAEILAMMPSKAAKAKVGPQTVNIIVQARFLAVIREER